MAGGGQGLEQKGRLLDQSGLFTGSESGTYRNQRMQELFGTSDFRDISPADIQFAMKLENLKRPDPAAPPPSPTPSPVPRELQEILSRTKGRVSSLADLLYPGQQYTQSAQTQAAPTSLSNLNYDQILEMLRG
jgi:hypothetical protein